MNREELESTKYDLAVLNSRLRAQLDDTKEDLDEKQMENTRRRRSSSNTN